jgi:hypothetical protein
MNQTLRGNEFPLYAEEIVVNRTHYEKDYPDADRVCSCFGRCHRLFHSRAETAGDFTGNPSPRSFAFAVT